MAWNRIACKATGFRATKVACWSAARRAVPAPADLPGRLAVDRHRQPLGVLAIDLLQPQSPDSFWSWGFFNSTPVAAEEPEEYVMEPMARKMLAEDPALKAAFDKRLREDKAFAADPQARLQWFYQRTPFYDVNAFVYPVGVVF